MNELDLFAAAIAVADPAERAALLERECAGRPDLRRRLDLLLEAHGRSHLVLDLPNAGDPDATGAYTPAPSLIGTIIAGRYKLLEELGDGGMGTVWMAEQREPVKRLVAVKLIKAGMDSRAVLARFEAERQALALMDHPNIAQVLDGGTTEDGRPFFVMELVKGLPLTEYCDARRLSVKDRLDLFVQICSAVQHAHQKAVIHRDLKPSNVLVTEHDGKPVPKVIDFGLAKALNASNMLTERTLHTAYGTVVGTPLYMAPEQVGINALDVDTRTDVYALGVILYELLTGSTPIERARFKEAAWDEVKRLIREEEPPRPSTRLSSDKTLPSLAASRQVEPAQLRRLLRGDLDWIVMKALDKDRSRRYETPNGLAADVQRYLCGEAVLAHPPSAAYRLRKVLRRNKGPVLAALLVLFVLVGGIIGTTIGLVRARAESKRANEERDRAVRAEEEAVAKGREATAERNRATEKAELAEAVSEFLRTDILAATPFDEAFARHLGSEITVAEAVDAAAAKVGKRFADRPLVEAMIRSRLGNTYLELGKGDKAAAQLEGAVRLFRRVKGEEDDAESIRALSLLAWTRLDQGRTDPGRMAESERLHAEAVRRAEHALPEDHPHRLTAYNHYAYCLTLQRKFDAAESFFRRAIAGELKRGETPDLQMTRNNLALMYRLQQRYDEADSLFRQALAENRRLLGDTHPNTVLLLRNLSHVCCDEGKWDDAASFAQEALTGERKVWGRRGRAGTVVQCYEYLSEAAFHLRKPDDHHARVDELIAAIEPRSEELGPTIRPRVLVVARNASALGHFDQSARLYEILLRAMRDQTDAWTTFEAQSLLGGALLGQKKYADAEPLLLKGYEGMKQREKTIPAAASSRITDALDRLIELYTAMNRPDEVKKWQTERAKYPEPKSAGKQ